MTGKVDWLVAGHTLSRLTNAKRYKGHGVLQEVVSNPANRRRRKVDTGDPARVPDTLLM